MAHIHRDRNGENIVFYTDDTGNVWVRAFTLFKAAGIKAPGPTLRSYIISHPGTGQKFTYPGDATGDANAKYSSPAWHSTYAEAIKSLNGRQGARGSESTVRALLSASRSLRSRRGLKPAKAKPAPVVT